ncbi:GNAT family N-acetyltransferase [Persicirhabdus sediminis]|uniref:GNAT family N-acetyltransferase n=1 Tax=Persicirhabdus sediminis TaxID=454144 RepID=A0A8J7MCH0_9BACT|nr:GNAT family N-acetyltransferase [Persicirhabdus sediminis]MBK1790048.1 GNAT family N-acetyltransferase [Persicirhabdus sediminis]
MKFTKRATSEDDYGYAKGIHDLAYRDWTVAQFGPWDEKVQGKFFDDSWNYHNYELLLLDGVPCGYCAVDYNEHVIRVLELAVDPDFQGQGVGTSFFHDLINRYHSESRSIRLNAFKVNTAAIDFYLGRGFVVIAENDLQLQFEWQGEDKNLANKVSYFNEH